MHENPQQLTPEAEFPLKHWFSNFSSEDRDAIQIDIFDSNDKLGPVEFALDNIKDQEVARGIMLRFKRYLAIKREGRKDAIKVEANDLITLVEKELDKILVTLNG
ncbi:MAG: hypothetical protein WCG97_03280 [bacterium]